jgi:hypothetical protein
LAANLPVRKTLWAFPKEWIERGKDDDDHDDDDDDERFSSLYYSINLIVCICYSYGSHIITNIPPIPQPVRAYIF